MSDLTVGQVSGLIAAGVFLCTLFCPTGNSLTNVTDEILVHLLLPLVFPAILAGFIEERNTVVTW